MKPGTNLSISERYKQLKPQGGNRLSPRPGIYRILQVEEHDTFKGFYIAKALWKERHSDICYERLHFYIQLNAFKLAVDNPETFSPLKLSGYTVLVKGTRWTQMQHNGQEVQALVCDWVYDITYFEINRGPLPFLETLGGFEDSATMDQMLLFPSNETGDTGDLDGPGDDGFDDEIDDDRLY